LQRYFVPTRQNLDNTGQPVRLVAGRIGRPFDTLIAEMTTPTALSGSSRIANEKHKAFPDCQLRKNHPADPTFGIRTAFLLDRPTPLLALRRRIS
jgi:hypothetical protein